MRPRQKTRRTYVFPFTNRNDRFSLSQHETKLKDLYGGLANFVVSIYPEKVSQFVKAVQLHDEKESITHSTFRESGGLDRKYASKFVDYLSSVGLVPMKAINRKVKELRVEQQIDLHFKVAPEDKVHPDYSMR